MDKLDKYNPESRAEQSRAAVSYTHLDVYKRQPYILWKEGYHIEDIGCLGNDEYRNPKFRINAHRGKTY